VKILWEGFLLKDLIEESGISPEAQVAIFRAYDGYSTSLQLDYLLENDILLGYKMNGLVLPAERGFPLQLVAESRYGYKWIKWITEIELSNDVNYKGYWGKQGLPNDPVIRPMKRHNRVERVTEFASESGNSRFSFMLMRWRKKYLSRKTLEH